jgi:hypothetical protein
MLLLNPPHAITPFYPLFRFVSRVLYIYSSSSSSSWEWQNWRRLAKTAIDFFPCLIEHRQKINISLPMTSVWPSFDRDWDQHDGLSASLCREPITSVQIAFLTHMR